MYPYFPSMALSLPSIFNIGRVQIQYYTYTRRRVSLQYFKITPSAKYFYNVTLVY